ncbi:MAG: cysteine desulfurase family protein [Bacteroidota bacterium]
MDRIYLDHNSTTPVDAQVLEAMLPYFREHFGNASSRTHAFGWVAAAAVEQSRREVAGLIGAEPDEVVFTSGATEALNIAIHGICSAYASRGRHLVVCVSEHKAVLEPIEALESQGWSVTRIGIDREGLIDHAALQQAVRSDTVLVAVMFANNETGVIQDVERIGKLTHERGAVFLCDTTQAAGKVRVDVQAHNIGVCTLSAHKLGGPKGVGALYIRRKHPRIKVSPLSYGGGQERGIRPGTLNEPGIVGLGTACRLATERLWDYGSRVSRLRTILEQELCVELQLGYINGSVRSRLPNTTNIRFSSIRAERLITAIPGIACSAGSACTSALPEPSHVLQAMGLDEEACNSSLRFSLGADTTEAEIRQTITQIEVVLRAAKA